MSIYSRLVSTVPPEHIDHWQSDLYVKVTPQSTAVINSCDEDEMPIKPKIFTDNIEHKPWYEIPFAYDPFWDAAFNAGRK